MSSRQEFDNASPENAILKKKPWIYYMTLQFFPLSHMRLDNQVGNFAPQTKKLLICTTRMHDSVYVWIFLHFVHRGFFFSASKVRKKGLWIEYN